MGKKIFLLNFTFLLLALIVFVIILTTKISPLSQEPPPISGEIEGGAIVFREEIAPDPPNLSVLLLEEGADPVRLKDEEGIYHVDYLGYQTEKDTTELSFQGNDETLGLSWNEGQIDVFSIALYDTELFLNHIFPEALVWRVDSMKIFPESDADFIRENLLGIISPAYILGDAIPGFRPETSKKIQLTVGREYLLEITGLIIKNGEDQLATIERLFNFTNSCLPPNCK